MANRGLLCGAATVEVDMWRYDELLRKEERLNIIEKLIKNEISAADLFAFIINNDKVVENE